MPHALRLRIPPTLTTPLAVYCTPRRDLPDPKSIIAAGVESRATGLMREAVQAFLSKGLLEVMVLPRGKLPDPPAPLLQAMRPQPDAWKRFQAATHLVFVRASYIVAPPPFHYWAALAAAGAIAEATDGVMLDVLVPRLLPLEHRTRAVPEDGRVTVVREVIAPMSTQQNGTVLITTKGLSRFGIPEMQLDGVPPGIGGDALPLVNAAAQRLLHELYVHTSQENARQQPLTELVLDDELRIDVHDVAAAWGKRAEEGSVDAAGGTTVRLSYAPATGGTEPFVVIQRPREFRGEHGEWLYEALSSLTSAGPADGVVHRESGGDALRRATDRARGEMPSVRDRFVSGLPLGAKLYVKRGFPVRDLTEFMWVAVTRWDGARVHGALANTSDYDPSLRAGHSVDFADAEVTDWIIRHDDGRTEGGYSIAALAH